MGARREDLSTERIEHLQAAVGSFAFGDDDRRGFRLALLWFVLGFGACQIILALSIEIAIPLAPVAIAALAILAGACFVYGLRDSRRAPQRFFLTLSMLPILTLARLSFQNLVTPITQLLLVYTLLAVALLTFRQTVEPGAFAPLRDRRVLIGWSTMAVFGGVVFAAAGFRISLFSSDVSAPLTGAVLVAIPLSAIDEFWFRGLLQSNVAEMTSRREAYLAIVLLFVGYGLPFPIPGPSLGLFGTLGSIAYRFPLAAVLGWYALVPRRTGLAVFTRVVAALVFSLFAPALVSSPYVV
jgi:hypothetical protein